ERGGSSRRHLSRARRFSDRGAARRAHARATVGARGGAASRNRRVIRAERSSTCCRRSRPASVVSARCAAVSRRGAREASMRARFLVAFAAALGVGITASPRSEAGHHLWKWSQIFSNASGSTQFAELFVGEDGEAGVGPFTVTTNTGHVFN